MIFLIAFFIPFFPVLANIQHSKSHATVREGRKCTHLMSHENIQFVHVLILRIHV